MEISIKAHKMYMFCVFYFLKLKEFWLTLSPLILKHEK